MKSRLICLALLLTVIIYLPGLTGGFAFDDYANIVQNPYFTKDISETENLNRAVWSGQAGPLKRPIPMLSFALNAATTGHWPMAYKVTNLGIHLITGVLAFFCALLLLQAHLNQRKATNSLILISAAVATVWLIHPINLTPVLYVVQRMTSLAALFSFAAVCVFCLGRFALIDGKKAKAAIHLFLSCPLFVVLGAYSKENALLVVPTILVVEYFLFRFRGFPVFSERVLRTSFQLLVIFGVAILLWYFSIYRPDYLSHGFAGRPFTLLERILTEMRVLWFYVFLMVAPQLSEFGLFHDDIMLSIGIFQPISTLFAALGLLAICFTSIFFARKFPMFGFCVFWYLIAHSMESTIFPLELVHEHRNYFPSFGIFLGLAYGMSVVVERFQVHRAAYGITALIICMLSALTYLRAEIWSDPVTLALTEAQYHPNSYRSVYAAGRIYYGLYQMRGEQRYYDKAVNNLLVAAELDKDAKRPYFGLIKLALRTEKTIPQNWHSELLYRLQYTLFSHTDWLEMHRMVKCHAENDDCNVPKQELVAYFQASLSNPTISADTKSQLLLDLGIFYVNELGDMTKASELLGEAVALTPAKFELSITYAEILMLAKHYDQLALELDRITARSFWRDAHTYSNERIAALRRELSESF